MAPAASPGATTAARNVPGTTSPPVDAAAAVPAAAPAAPIETPNLSLSRSKSGRHQHQHQRGQTLSHYIKRQESSGSRKGGAAGAAAEGATGAGGKKQEKKANNPKEHPHFKWILWGSFLLTINAGFINTITLHTLSAMPSAHVTGMVAKASNFVAQGDGWNFMIYLVSYICFVAGSMTGGMLVNYETFYLGRMYGRCLLILAAIQGLALIVENSYDNSIIFIWLATYSCGLQNSMTSKYSGNAVRTTHLTGASTDMGIALGHILKGRREEWWKVQMHGIAVVGFFMGGILGYFAFEKFEHAALLVNVCLTSACGIIHILYVAYHERMTVISVLESRSDIRIHKHRRQATDPPPASTRALPRSPRLRTSSLTASIQARTSARPHQHQHHNKRRGSHPQPLRPSPSPGGTLSPPGTIAVATAAAAPSSSSLAALHLPVPTTVETAPTVASLDGTATSPLTNSSVRRTTGGGGGPSSSVATDAAVIAAEEGGVQPGHDGEEEDGEEVWGHSPSSSVCGLEEEDDIELTPEELGPLPTYEKGDIIAAMAAAEEEEESQEDGEGEGDSQEEGEEGDVETGRAGVGAGAGPGRPPALLLGRRDGASPPLDPSSPRSRDRQLL